MTEAQKDNLKYIIRRLRATRQHETICLMGWEVGTLLDFIDEMTERTEKHEQADYHREPDKRP